MDSARKWFAKCGRSYISEGTRSLLYGFIFYDLFIRLIKRDDIKIIESINSIIRSNPIFDKNN